jgi:hypothetical protein
VQENVGGFITASAAITKCHSLKQNSLSPEQSKSVAGEVPGTKHKRQRE